MAEKRFYKMTGKNANGRNVEAYYAGHGLDKIRLDAAEDAGAFPSDITHKTMKATEFYDELDRTEASKRVKSSKVRGIGRKWVVEEEEMEEDSEPYGDPCNEPPPGDGIYRDANGVPLNPFLDDNLLKAFEDAGYPHIPNQIEDDRVGLPDDDDEYEEDEVKRYYGKYAIGGYPVSPDEKEDKYDTGKLEIPTEEQQKAELERLRKDPNTYPYPREEILDEDILSTSSNIPTRGTQQTYV